MGPAGPRITSCSDMIYRSLETFIFLSLKEIYLPGGSFFSLYLLEVIILFLDEMENQRCILSGVYMKGSYKIPFGDLFFS